MTSIVSKTASITTSISGKPIPFSVRWLERGDAYGLNNKLTYDQTEPCVEFYDQRYFIDQNPLGQFVSRYYVSSLRFTDKGLNLQGDVPDWKICAQGMHDVRAWMSDHLEAQNLLFILSPDQHHAYRIWQGAAHAGLDVSNEEIRAAYDTPAARQAHDTQWIESMRNAFANGVPLTDMMLNRLEKLRPGAVTSFWHDYPDAKIPEGYEIPAQERLRDSRERF